MRRVTSILLATSLALGVGSSVFFSRSATSTPFTGDDPPRSPVAVTIDLAGLAPDTCDDVTATVAGAEANDWVGVTANFDMAADDVLLSNGRVTNAATDEVTFRVCNVDGAAMDPASGPFLFLLRR